MTVRLWSEIPAWERITIDDLKRCAGATSRGTLIQQRKWLSVHVAALDNPPCKASGGKNRFRHDGLIWPCMVKPRDGGEFCSLHRLRIERRASRSPIGA